MIREAPGSAIPPRPDVEVRYSARRRKTATAWLSDGRIVVVLPSRISAPESARLVDRLVARIVRKNANLVSSDRDLAERAARLADRYVDGVRPRSIRWSERQVTLWGSCTPTSGDIRIAERLRVTPPWVVDAVIVHELCHLIEKGHNERFRALTARFDRTADAGLFLEGFGLGLRSGPA